MRAARIPSRSPADVGNDFATLFRQSHQCVFTGRSRHRIVHGLEHTNLMRPVQWLSRLIISDRMRDNTRSTTSAISPEPSLLTRPLTCRDHRAIYIHGVDNSHHSSINGTFVGHRRLSRRPRAYKTTSPAPTESAALQSCLCGPYYLKSRTTYSFSFTSFSSFRVDTTVPTMRPSFMRLTSSCRYFRDRGRTSSMFSWGRGIT